MLAAGFFDGAFGFREHAQTALVKALSSVGHFDAARRPRQKGDAKFGLKLLDVETDGRPRLI